MPVSDRLRSKSRIDGDAPGRAVTVIGWPMLLLGAVASSGCGNGRQSRHSRGLTLRDHGVRPSNSSNALCRSAPGSVSWSVPNAPLPSSISFCGSMTVQHASTSSGSSVVSWPVALATSQPWTTTSMNRCPRYTSPGTGPYDTAQGASIAPGAWNASLAARADSSYAAVGSSPSMSPSRRSPTSSIVFPRASSAAQKFPLTMWSTSSRTSQPSHGDALVHWSPPTPATYRRVPASARSWRPGKSDAMFAPCSEQTSGRRRHTPPAQPVHEDPRASVDRARPVPRQRRLVDRRRVPDVRLEVIRRVVLGFLPHERVARDLRDTRRRRHRKRRRVASNDGRDARTQCQVVVVAVEDDAIGLVPECGELPERAAPGGSHRRG